MGSTGRMLVVVGLGIALVGAVLVLGERFGLGKLPGDFVVKKKNWSFHFPLATSLIVSVVLTVLLNLILRRK